METKQIELNQENKDRAKYIGKTRVFKIEELEQFAENNNLSLNIHDKTNYLTVSLQTQDNRISGFAMLYFTDHQNDPYYELFDASITKPTLNLLEVLKNLLVKLEIE